MPDRVLQKAKESLEGAPSGKPEFSQSADLPEPGFVPVPGVLGFGRLGSLSLLRRVADESDPLGGSTVGGSVLELLRRRRGSGQPLTGSVAESMGALLGIDTSNLRLHTDAEAGSIARSFQAAAFTHGNDIYFAPDSYRPSSAAGRRVLAHEMSHVAAQRAGTDRAAGGGLTVGRAGDPAEAAADRSADRVLAALRRSTAVAAQRDRRETSPTDSVAPELRRAAGGHRDALAVAALGIRGPQAPGTGAVVTPTTTADLGTARSVSIVTFPNADFHAAGSGQGVQLIS